MPTRRQFMQSSAAIAASAALRLLTRAGRRIILGVIGPGGMGTNLLNSFAAQKDVRIATSATSTPARQGRRGRKAIPRQRAQVESDLRRVLDDTSVDAVFIATPDHWHAPATILACDAGKHVYVEKPCSHNIREGRLMVEAAAQQQARRAGRHAEPQHAARACEAMQLLHERRDRRGPGRQGVEQPAPRQHRQAQAEPIRRRSSTTTSGSARRRWCRIRPNRCHGIWRWWHDFGTGDMGNDGVHDIDIARWGLGVDDAPDRRRRPRRQVLLRRRPAVPRHAVRRLRVARRRQARQASKQLIFEQRIWSPYVQEGYENGNAFYGTKGMLILGKHGGWKLYGQRNKLIDEA